MLGLFPNIVNNQFGQLATDRRASKAQFCRQLQTQQKQHKHQLQNTGRKSEKVLLLFFFFVHLTTKYSGKLKIGKNKNRGKQIR
jgi:hypothetical protein